jgi:hypothetical protein
MNIEIFVIYKAKIIKHSSAAYISMYACIVPGTKMENE